MAGPFDCSDTARRQLRKLDWQTARRIVDFMDRPIARTENQRSVANTLTSPLGGFRRYQAGDYRGACDIQYDVLRVLLVRVGDQCEIYR